MKKYTSEDVFEVIETVMNDIRRSILKHLSKVKKMKFSDILGALEEEFGSDRVKSNTLAYHLKIMLEVGLLKNERVRRESYYSLSERGEKLLRAIERLEKSLL